MSQRLVPLKPRRDKEAVLSRLKRPPVDVAWKLGEKGTRPSSLDHSSQLRGLSSIALVQLYSVELISISLAY
ncbi:hypothetical protein TNCV_3424411 [Trichonephila clavipes]|nr:hypothetical protein TNCV_3424411 [Trichonephila clavipes]